ncbi:hypothetical protein, partial [Sphingopyxis granuli]|uniref:hypothetical protein n=1 Tax=Sphingopyxis granuli TaxID=267128 RepID=UPI00301DEA05
MAASDASGAAAVGFATAAAGSGGGAAAMAGAADGDGGTAAPGDGAPLPPTEKPGPTGPDAWLTATPIGAVLFVGGGTDCAGAGDGACCVDGSAGLRSAGVGVDAAEVAGGVARGCGRVSGDVAASAG